MGLVADRLTLYQTKNPAHSVTPRQQRYLAVRGASSMLEHPAFLILERSGRVPTSVSPTGDRGFESVSLLQRVRREPGAAATSIDRAVPDTTPGRCCPPQKSNAPVVL